jgi:hypothetical protein
MYGFAVTQPGPVSIVVQTRGAPVVVQLTGPIAKPLQQQGSGVLQLQYSVTPQDVQRGVLWGLTIQPVGDPASRADGTVAVQHPQADPAVLQAAIASLRARSPARPNPQELAQRVAAEIATRNAAFHQRQQAGENELTQRRATIGRNLQPQIDALRMGSSPSDNGISSRALPPMKGGATLPHINSMSAGEGVPGDPVMIAGTGFGAAGQVHFVIGPDPQKQDLIANTTWGNGQIGTSVPDPSVPDPSVGALPYVGFVYVVVGNNKSNFVPFKFDPIIDHRLIRVAASLNPSDANDYINNGREIRHERGFDLFSGTTGMDVIDANVLLLNGWVVEGMPSYFGLGSTSVSASVGPILAAIGSPSLRTQAFWWMSQSVYTERRFGYYIEIPIRGPRGLPDGVACTVAPAPMQKCPDIIQ